MRMAAVVALMHLILDIFEGVDGMRDEDIFEAEEAVTFFSKEMVLYIGSWPIHWLASLAI